MNPTAPAPTRRMTVLACAVAAALATACGGGDGGPDITVPANNGLAADTPAEYTPPGAALTQYQLHLDNATANAGKSPLFVEVLRPQWCFGAENAGAPPQLSDRNIVPATKVFDDVYFTGYRTVGQYAFKMPRGIFLMDSLYNQSDVETITQPQLRSVGLDPASIFAVFPTHGHGDHDGGAAFLQSSYRVPVYLGSADYTAAKAYIATTIDSANLAPQPYLFGDLAMTLLSTPGHTAGTVSGVIPVKHNGSPHKMAFWGGTAMPNNVPLARGYLDGVERLYKLSRAEGIDGTIHTHAFVDGSLRHVDEIRASGLGAQNPFVIGNADALRSLAVLRNCSAAKVAQVDATAMLPEWRVSTVETAATWIKGQSANNLSATARVKSPYGVVTAGAVAFSFAPGGETCTANVGNDGLATCTVSSASATQAMVQASYAGAESATLVSLPGTGSANVAALD